MHPGDTWKRAIRRAGMPFPAVVLFDTLVDRADYQTGHLPDDRQPRSIAELAGWAGLPLSTLKDSLSVLEAFGWVTRERPAKLRRGQSTTYQPALGRQRRQRQRALTDAERARNYRARKRADQATRHDHLAYNGASRPDTSVTRNPAANTGQIGVTNTQVNGQVAQGAIEGGSTDLPGLISWTRLCRDQTLGPCTRCGDTCVRYGVPGRPLCDHCNVERQAGLAE